MPRIKKPKIPHPFRFPVKRHCRAHGPQGHQSYKAYKPWLRDEFQFRCVYCLTRERWIGDGHNRFSIDHVKPQITHDHLSCDYDNLVYACLRCNTLKKDKTGLPDPCKTSLHKHIKLSALGKFVGLTPQGKRLVEYLMLNSEERVGDRRAWLRMFEGQNRWDAESLLWRFGYPSDLPNLAKLKPPKGNKRPKGLERSYHLRKTQGKLPLYY